MPRRAEIGFLDPAIGTGAFYSALLRHFSSERISYAKGFDIDSHYTQVATDLRGETGVSIETRDFTKRAFPTKNERYNLLICNPPYVRHHHIKRVEKERLQHKTNRSCRMALSGLSGLYCYFLGLSHGWMEDGGVAGWLIHSEFMDVNYGEAVRRYLLHEVTLLHIHRFDPRTLQFGDAMVSSCVVWFKKQQPPKSHGARFTYGGTLSSPDVERMVLANDLQAETKWTRFPEKSVRVFNNSPRVSDLFDIKRGLATGANEFFILEESQIAKCNLPREVLRPILPGPRYLETDEICADTAGNPLVKRPMYLLDCKLTEEEIRRTWPSLALYLSMGKRVGVNRRYLCSNRKPWYTQEKRSAPPIICTYLGRKGTRTGKPFRFILNHSMATVPNTFLALYPKPFLAAQIKKNKGVLRAIWRCLIDIESDQILEAGRVYGGGLYKLEPRELGMVSLPEMMRPLVLAGDCETADTMMPQSFPEWVTGYAQKPRILTTGTMG